MKGKKAIAKRGQHALAQDDNGKLIGMWLHGRNANTQEAYQRDIDRFLRFVKGKPLPAVTLPDLQAYAEELVDGGLKDGSQKRMLSAVKSLLTFACKTVPSYFRANVGAALRVPHQEQALRILPEPKVHEIIALETNRRDRVLLRSLYASGGRVSEIQGLHWSNTADRDDGKGQITVTGKGGKVRSILLSPETWAELKALRGDAGDDEPVFKSRKGGPLTRVQIFRIVKAAGQRVGLPELSPHWFRHAHISHALDRGAPIHVVQATAGHASLNTTSAYAHARPDDSSALYLGV